MLADMTPEQLDGWRAFDMLEPLGSRALWHQMTTVLSMLAARSGVEVDPADYMPGMKVDD